MHLLSALLSLAILGADLARGSETDGGTKKTIGRAAFDLAARGPISAGDDGAAGARVVLQAATGATIGFRPQNGESTDGVPPEMVAIPHLVLYRNGVLTDPGERTLLLEVDGLVLPPAGITVTLRVETQHGDPDQAGDSPPRIPVWTESWRLIPAGGLTQTGVTIVLAHEFDQAVVRGPDRVATPTDYFRYDLSVTGPQDLPVLHQDYAFLLENQWLVSLPPVPEEIPGAAPDELIVYYCDMFPVRHDINDAATWLLRRELTSYLRAELIPAMVAAFRLQSEGWAFPWYREWTAYRPGADARRLSVALSDGRTWFHGRAPRQGDASMTIDTGDSKVEYETLTDGLMRIFYHELFHHHQRNINQHLDGDGDVDGPYSAGALFVEGTAVLAAAVGQDAVQFGRSWGIRSYLANATGFMGRDGFAGGDLNRSYREMNPYHSAVYWRFLYEQCGGLEAASSGMQVIRRVLLTLYGREIAGSGSAADPVQTLPAVMNRSLPGSGCPFETHEESLLAFARAIYALRLEGGRCLAAGTPAGCGFYDPQALYPDPPVETILYRGAELAHTAGQQAYPAGIPASFGIDLIDIILDASLDGQPLVLEFRGRPAAAAEFAVQLWRLRAPANGSPSRPVAAWGTGPELLTVRDQNGQLVYPIPALDLAEYNRLGLIVTRVDADERLDPDGSYTVLLHPGTPPVPD